MTVLHVVLYYKHLLHHVEHGKGTGSCPFSRNVNQRKSLSMASSIVKNVGTGVISILFPTILSAVVSTVHGDEAQGYFATMAVIACLAIPLTFIQYFYTREHVTEERRYGAVAGADAGAKAAVKEKTHPRFAIPRTRDDCYCYACNLDFLLEESTLQEAP